MSSFLNDKSFNTSFKKGAWKKHPYGDPTYLSFFIMFDFNGLDSPLFNGEAEKYLRDFCGENERADKLVKFKTYLEKINKELPWFWQSIEGVETALKYDITEPYRGGKESALKVSCLESIDLSISGLFSLYRDSCYDWKRWVEVIPLNLREFTVYVRVAEIRNISTKKLKTSGGQATNDFINQNRKYNSINEEITGDVMPHFVFKFSGCEFDYTQGNGIVSSLSKIEMTQAKQSMNIKYRMVEEYSKVFLNAFDKDLLASENKYSGVEIPDLYSGPKSLGDQINEQFQNAKSNITDKFKEIEETVQGSPAELQRQGLAAATGFASGLVSDTIAGLILGNVYGNNTISNVQDALNSGNINAIANLINQEQNNSSTIETDGPLGNIFPSTPEESSLTSTNIFPTSQPEQPLGPGNVYPPPSNENDSQLGNIHD